MDMVDTQGNEMVDVHYLDPGGTKFSLVGRLSIPVTETVHNFPEAPAFSADGSKFAMGLACGGVSVWNVRNKVPLQTFTEVLCPWQKAMPYRRLLQFSSGNSGKEFLVFVEVCLMFTL